MRIATSDRRHADFLSGDKSAGQASGFGPWIVVDEIGLLKERDRELVSQMLASVSARDGRMLAISVMGGSPLTQELVDRREDPAVVVHTYQAPEKCELDDPAAWALANPGIAEGIKSESYMSDMARRAKMLPAERAAFLTYDLNRPTAPTQDMIVSPEELAACEVEQLPRRTGKCWLGLDLGNTLSMSAAVAVWDNGRAEYLCAWGDKPTLADRGQVDGVGALYELAEEAGELVTIEGAAVDPGTFLARVLDWLDGEKVACCAFDTYKAAAIQLELDNAPGIRWPTYVTERTRRGASHRSADIDRFRLAVLQERLRFAKPNLLMSSAVARSHVHVGSDNLAELRKAMTRARIDVLSASLLAVGARDSRPMKRRPTITVVA